MRLSLIMPAFNAADTVQKAVTSVAALTHCLNGQVRMIAVDDCSTDNTLQILEELGRQHGFLDVHRMPENSGPGSARNFALDLISEGWIGFIDADDEIVPEAYASCLQNGENAGKDFITFNGYFVNGDASTPKYDFNRIADNQHKMTRNSLRSELDGSVIFSIYHSALIAKQGLRFGNFFYEDIVFSNLGLIFAERRLICDEYCYKKHWLGSSIVNTVSERHIKGLVSAVVDLRKSLERSGLFNDDLLTDFAYGAHGYVAKAVTDTLRSVRHNDEQKLALLRLLAQELSGQPILRDMPRLANTKKDKLCNRMRQLTEAGQIDRDGLAELTKLVEDTG